MIQSIQVNSDETISQLKSISLNEDELLSQLNFIEQSLQSYSQEISIDNKHEDNLYQEITEVSQKINQIGNTIDDINQRCEPHDNNNNGNNIEAKNTNTEEGEMNKVLNEFYYELRKIEFAEQALLSKLNIIQKEIDDKNTEMELKMNPHF